MPVVHHSSLTIVPSVVTNHVPSRMKHVPSRIVANTVHAEGMRIRHIIATRVRPIHPSFTAYAMVHHEKGGKGKQKDPAVTHLERDTQ